MKLIYTKEGISKNEKEEWRVIIFNNLLDGLRMILDAMEEMGIDFQYDNTTVSPLSRSRNRREGPVRVTNHFNAGPSPRYYARKGPPTF